MIFSLFKYQNPDIVLVHYLNVPYPDDNKMAVIAPSISLWGDKKEWTKEELVSQLKPMRKYKRNHLIFTWYQFRVECLIYNPDTFLKNSDNSKKYM